MTAILNLSGIPATQEQQDAGWNDPSQALNKLVSEFAHFSYPDPSEDEIAERAACLTAAIRAYDVNQTTDGIGIAHPEAVVLPNIMNDDLRRTVSALLQQKSGIQVIEA
jgi:hypothetical protein